MVTLRLYLNFAQAALAKSILDDYEIFCALFDENMHLYRAPFAIPIRLMVDERQAAFAFYVLQGDLDKAAEAEARAGEMELVEFPSRNPWEILVVAFYYLLPGLCYVGIEGVVFRPHGLPSPYGTVSVSVAHFFGWITVGFAARESSKSLGNPRLDWFADP